ncbi:MAG: hypothetical protein ACJAT4_001094 [Granulosicoccus sp.]|jgi:hypothetical protein
MMKNLLTITILFFATISFGQFDSLGIIGSSTDLGWDAQTNMTNDAGNTDMWTINIDLKNGASKFRTDDTWVTNWGSADFPMGTGTQGGADVPTPGGNYDVTFNSATGEYNFEFQDSIYGSVGLIGEAGIDWSTDLVLTQVANAPWTYRDTLDLNAGECKFRADGVWMDEWADAGDGLSGVAATSGGGNFVVPSSGEYLVELNTATGEYNIQSFIPIYATMGVIGAGSPTGAWDTEMAMSNINGNVHQWAITGDFDGEFKFRGDSSWDYNWGADGVQDFPIDTALFNSSTNIVAPMGTYLLEYNDTSGIYEFKDPIVDYATIGVIGDAVGGWDDDIDMFKNPSPTASDEWLLTITLGDGELKFRADDDWTDSWGDTGFPTGSGSNNGDPNIGVFAGTWTIAFNSSTGDYSFTPASIGSIGPASPTAGWDDDTDFAQDATTVGLWTATQTLTAGEFKFRKDDAWDVNWGGVDFPMGAASQNGPNINIDVDGTYLISLQATNEFAGIDEYNGDYSFSIIVGTNNPFNVNDVKIIPNPATDLVNVTIEGVELQGEAQVMIFDMTGKLMQTGTYESTNNISFNVANYPMGFYVIQMRGEGFLVSKRFVVAK